MIQRLGDNRPAMQISEALAGLLGVSSGDVELRPNDPSGAGLVITAAGQTFVVEFKQTTSAASVVFAAKKVLEHTKRMRRRGIPLVVVPFMGDVGRRACEEAGVNWLDLCGNAHIITSGIRVHVEGRPNRFRLAGRPPNLFAPKSSRVVRWLLIHFAEWLTQREIARATGMDEGFVSRIVARLEREGFVVRGERSAVRPRDSALLLDAWRERYQFVRHSILQGHVAARSGDALLRFACDAFAAQGVEYAATGLAAAWALTHFAAFRVAAIYLTMGPSAPVLERLGFKEEPRGANLWLVVPNDAGVFQGAVEKDGIRCAHPVQVYLDLKDQPERAAEAAERLRGELLTWGRNA
jgi:DNA-binding MarR family transcriptional regulator